MVRVQEAQQTAAEGGEAELGILDFKTTWSEFQKASQTTAKRGKLSCIYIHDPHGQSSRRPVRILLSEAKPSCIY